MTGSLAATSFELQPVKAIPPTNIATVKSLLNLDIQEPPEHKLRWAVLPKKTAFRLFDAEPVPDF
jgi:hypothetical protein